MATKIVVDPAKLQAAAVQMETQAGDYEQQYQQLFNEVDGMGAAWQGADNVAFVTQIKGFMDDFQKMKALMQQYADYLRTSATEYKATQDDRIAQAKNLTN